jgi:hypothetical protein
MFITKKHIPRRTLLRGMGSAIALPLLESMVPARTAIAQSAARPAPRFCAIEIVHGAGGSTLTGEKEHYWVPAKEGPDFELGLSLKPLEPLREHVTIVSNTDLNGARTWEYKEEGADHTRSSAVYLSGAHPKMTAGADYLNGTTIDQIYAMKRGQDTPLPSLQLAIEDAGSLNGTCDYRYSCVYANTISWSSPTTPLPMEIDPRVVFEQMFGEGATPEERLARRRQDRSILDTVVAEVTRLRGGLDPSDRNRLNSYLEDVREVERRIQRIEKFNATGEERALPNTPVGVPDSFEEHVTLMFDLQVLAFMTNVTRVSAFKMGRDVSSRVYPDSGIKTPFHALSHHGEAPATILEFAKLNAYHVSKTAYFINKLKNTPDGDGTLLDHSLVMYGSPMGDSHVHEHKRLPVFLAGHANGAVRGNLHLKCPPGTPMANLLLTILHKLGVEDVDHVGDSEGLLSI